MKNKILEKALKLTESKRIDERTSPLPKATAFSLLFSYAGKDHKFVSKLTDIGGKLDRKKKEVYFDFTSAAARTKFRKKHKDIIKSLSESVELDEGIRDFKVGDKVKWVGEDEHEGDIESKNLIGQIGIIKTIQKFGRFHKGDIKFRKKLVRGVVLELDVIKESVEELDEKFGGKTNVPASKEIQKHIESGKALIHNNVLSSLHKSARFVVIKNPYKDRSEKGLLQDGFLMATISDPMKGRIKLFAYHGTHVSIQKAMDFAKKHKLVARTDKYGRPLYAKESVELDELKRDEPEVVFDFKSGRDAKQFAKDVENSGVGLANKGVERYKGKYRVVITGMTKDMHKKAIGKYAHKNKGEFSHSSSEVTPKGYGPYDESVTVNEETEWTLSIDFDRTMTDPELIALSKKFKKYYVGHGSDRFGGSDMGFEGPKSDLLKIKQYIEKIFKSQINKKNTFFAAT